MFQDGRAALHLASSGGHIDAVTALTLNGADVNAQDLVSYIWIRIQIYINLICTFCGNFVRFVEIWVN